MKYLSLLVFSICILNFAPAAEATIGGLQFGIGNWYSDDLRTSFQYGGGILVSPGVDWMEFTATFDRAPARVKAGDPLAAELKDKTLSFWRLGVTFPMPLEIHDFKSYLFPLVSYVITENADDISHGIGVGGGLEFLLYKNIIGARFEALEQFYKIPTSSGTTALQEDFFFALRLTARY